MSVHYGRTAWGNDGSTSDRAAASAFAIKKMNPQAQSGLYWIKNPTNGTAFQAYCDMSTEDEDGESGWMLVASWDTAYSWGQKVNSSSATFSTTALNTVSSNFGDFFVRRFRVQCANNLTNRAAASAADWYYNWRSSLRWKEVWAPDGSNYQYYLSSGTLNNVPRCCLKPFNGGYNLKFRYSAPLYRFNNLSDYGYTNTQTNNLALIGGSNAGVNGFCNFWNALTTAGQPFGVYNLSYDGSFLSGTTPSSDGTLAFPIQNGNYDTMGQDVDAGLAVKVGYDDNGVWYGATTVATSDQGNNGNANTKMWWWIK